MTDDERSKLKMAMAALSGAMRGTLDRSFGVLAGDVRWSWGVIEAEVPQLLAEVERQRQYREIVTAVAETEDSAYLSDAGACPLCGADMFAPGHDADCPVKKARALLAESTEPVS